MAHGLFWKTYAAFDTSCIGFTLYEGDQPYLLNFTYRLIISCPIKKQTGGSACFKKLVVLKIALER